MKKIAFMFLLIDNPHFQDIWDYYFSTIDPTLYNIYIHPKYPDKHTWKRDKIISNIVETGWGYIVNAYLQLFKEALKDPDNYYFLTISESCIPIKTFKSLQQFLFDNNISIVQNMRPSRYDMDVRVSKELKNKYPTILKHYARMCLTRDIVNKLVSSDNINDFINMHVGDEFFLTSIYPFPYLSFAITHDDWESINKIKKYIKNKIKHLYVKQEKYNQDLTDKIKLLQDEYNDVAKNPKTFSKLSKKDIELIKNSKSFFFRKFSKDSNIKNYIRHIINDRNEY